MSNINRTNSLLRVAPMGANLKIKASVSNGGFLLVTFKIYIVLIVNIIY